MTTPDRATQYEEGLLVLHIIDSLQSGIGTMVADLVRHTPSFRNHIIAFRGSTSELSAFQYRCPVEIIDVRRGGPGALIRLSRRIKAIGPDVVHSHSFLPRLSTLAAGRRPPPQITTIHTAYAYLSASALRSQVKRTIERWALRRVAGCVAVSREVAAALPAGWPPGTVIENGIDVRRILEKADEERRPSFGKDLDRPLLVSVGRLAPEKGYDILLNALKLVRKEVPASVVVVGEGPERPTLEALARRLGIANAVHLAGFHGNPFPLMAEADLFVSSSRFEGFALAPLEAMALGVPVVTTRTSGLPGVLTDGEDGFVCPAMEPSALAHTILRALRDPDALSRVAVAGKELARDRDISETAARYARLYQEVIR